MQFTRRTFTASAAASAGVLVTQKALAQSTPDATPIASDLESRLLGLLTEYGVPGAVIGAILPDSSDPVVLELGVANLETGEPIRADMHFRIASVTKTYVATVVLQLVDEGLISLDDTISSILPDLQIKNADVVTVRNLLSMRSGLPQLTDSPEYVEQYMLTPTEEAHFAEYSLLMADLPARSEPDTGFEYNNFNFNVLGEMIEVVTGAPWDANVQTRILDPLGLTTTHMATTPDMPTPFATGYGYTNQDVLAELRGESPAATPVIDLATPIPDTSPVASNEPEDLTLFNPTIAGAAGGLISTVADQLVWVQALGSGDLLSPELHAEQLDAYPLDETGQVGYGLGLLDIGGVIGHNGAINGYQAVVITAPDFGIHIAVLTNAHPTIDFADVATLIATEILS